MPDGNTRSKMQVMNEGVRGLRSVSSGAPMPKVNPPKGVVLQSKKAKLSISGNSPESNKRK